jgi:hypothetical protein
MAGDPIGKLSGESKESNASAIAKQAAEAPGAPSLYRGVVIDVIHDPAILDEEQHEEMGTTCKDASLLEIAPRNSCIVQIVTAGQGSREDAAYMVCFPFFPPYLGMPVKPGEHVWVFVEDNEAGPSASLGYWICRISEPDYVDDINFTHSDRGYNALTSVPDEREVEPPAEDDRGAGFPNGAGIPGKMRLRNEGKYDQIYSGSLGMQSVTLEPVPRWTKRPGDLVLQGSNNTMISLGEDRGYTKDSLEESFAEPPQWSNATTTGASLAQLNFDAPPEDGATDKNERTFSGTIDMVAGRGRYLPDPDSPAELTACRVITNSRNYDETDKNAVGAGNDADNVQNRLTDASEGDPDFFNDASRIYISMNTLPDFNFSLEYPQVPPAGDPNDGADIEILEEFAEGIGQAAIIAKSDEVRIIARQDLEAPDGPIQGSITIVKEGTADDEAGEGRGIITIRPDGVIMIDGPKVVIGSGIEKGPGEGAQVSLGLGATEPMLLGDLFITAIHNFANNLATTIETSISNLGAPTLMPPLRGHIATLKQEMDDARSKVAKLL